MVEATTSGRKCACLSRWGCIARVPAFMISRRSLPRVNRSASKKAAAAAKEEEGNDSDEYDDFGRKRKRFRSKGVVKGCVGCSHPHASPSAYTHTLTYSLSRLLLVTHLAFSDNNLWAMSVSLLEQVNSCQARA